MDFTITISWNPCCGEGQVTNVSGSSYDITGLNPGVRYGITLVAIGDGIKSDTVSICTTTLSSGEHNTYNACILSCVLRPISFCYTMHVGVCILYYWNVSIAQHIMNDKTRHRSWNYIKPQYNYICCIVQSYCKCLYHWWRCFEYCYRVGSGYCVWDPQCCCPAHCGGVWECHLCPRCQGAQTEEAQWVRPMWPAQCNTECTNISGSFCIGVINVYVC